MSVQVVQRPPCFCTEIAWFRIRHVQNVQTCALNRPGSAPPRGGCKEGADGVNPLRQEWRHVVWNCHRFCPALRAKYGRGPQARRAKADDPPRGGFGTAFLDRDQQQIQLLLDPTGVFMDKRNGTFLAFEIGASWRRSSLARAISSWRN